MAKNLHVGDDVYVPVTRVGLEANNQSAIFSGKIVAIEGRSIKVTLPNGEYSEFIPTSAVQKNIKLLVIKVGDFKTEEILLDPLQKSILQYFRLLLNDDEIVCESLRSLTELSIIWQKHHSVISHVIIVGHGSKNTIQFGNDLITPDQLSTKFSIENATPKQFVSLCCKTGYADFGKTFSKFPICDSLIAPFQSIHGAIASQFCQTYFAYHLLQGETVKVACKHAIKSTPGAVSFRLWKDGKLLAGQKT